MPIKLCNDVQNYKKLTIIFQLRVYISTALNVMYYNNKIWLCVWCNCLTWAHVELILGLQWQVTVVDADYILKR